MKQQNDVFYKVPIDGNFTVFDFDNRQIIRRLVDDSLEPFIELDMALTDMIDSAGIELLSKLNKSLQNRNGKLKITNVAPHVHEVLDVCGVSTLVGVELAR